MTRKLRRLLALLLCATTLFGAVLPPASATAAGAGAMMSHDDGSPCGGCDDGAPSACDEHCAALSAGLVVPAMPAPPILAAAAEPVAALGTTTFESFAGPPGRQPPR